MAENWHALDGSPVDSPARWSASWQPYATCGLGFVGRQRRGGNLGSDDLSGTVAAAREACRGKHAVAISQYMNR